MGRISTIPPVVLVLVAFAISGLLILGPTRGPGSDVPQVPPVDNSDSGGSAPPWQAVLGVPALPMTTNEKVQVPLHLKSPHPPGTVIPVPGLPEVDNGIPLPGGGYLPFLNGMTYSPNLYRDPRFGPVPPVVAKLVDGDGYEWWMHEDGSVTTSIYQQVTVPGEVYWDSATKHAVAAISDMIKIVEPESETSPRAVLGPGAPSLSEVEQELLDLAKQVSENPSLRPDRR